MKITINPQQIKYNTGKATLIKIPKSDWAFWLTNKCVFGNNIYLNENYEYFTTKSKNKKSAIDGQSLIDKFSNYHVYKKTRPNLVVREHVPENIKFSKERKIDNDLIR